MAGTALAPARAATTRWLWLSCRKQGLAYNFLSQFLRKKIKIFWTELNLRNEQICWVLSHEPNKNNWHIMRSKKGNHLITKSIVFFWVLVGFADSDRKIVILLLLPRLNPLCTWITW